MGILSAFASQSGLLGSPPASSSIIGPSSDSWLQPQQHGFLNETSGGYTPPQSDPLPASAPQGGQMTPHNAIMSLFGQSSAPNPVNSMVNNIKQNGIGPVPGLGIPQIAPINLPAPEAPFAQGYGGVPSHILQTGG